MIHRALKRIPGLFLTCAAASTIAQGVWAQCGSDPQSPPGAAAIDDSYNTVTAGSANHKWWLINNYVDEPNPGSPHPLPGATDGYINTNDGFNFRDSAGNPFHLADPSVMKYTSAYGTWFYITGTCDTMDTANFMIWRTRDFTTFEFHMMAFDETNRSGSNQWRGDCYYDSAQQRTVCPTLYANGHKYNYMSGPHLYDDFHQAAGSGRHIFLSFQGTEDSYDGWNDASVFLVRIREDDFLSWHAKSWSDVGRHFADTRSGLGYTQWYSYSANNVDQPFRIDAGQFVGHGIPASGDPDEIMGVYPTLMFDRPAYNEPGVVSLYDGLARRGVSYYNYGGMPWMVGDPCVFIDPNPNGAAYWRRVMFYMWMQFGSGDNSIPYNVPYTTWGNNLAAYPLLANNILFDEDSYGLTNGAKLIPVAVAANTNNKITGLRRDGVNPLQPIDNGRLVLDLPPPAPPYPAGVPNQTGASLAEWSYGGIAEAPAVLYMPAPVDRYYLFYSRNHFASSAYQIVYRKTAQGGKLLDLNLYNINGDLNSAAVQGVPETVLLRSDNYHGTTPNDTGPGGASFGSCHAFTITDTSSCSSVVKPYLAFHCKFDYDTAWQGTARRTLFFKELTIDPTTGDILQLAEQHTDKARDVRKFRIPRFRQ